MEAYTAFIFVLCFVCLAFVLANAVTFLCLRKEKKDIKKIGSHRVLLDMTMKFNLLVIIFTVVSSVIMIIVHQFYMRDLPAREYSLVIEKIVPYILTALLFFTTGGCFFSRIIIVMREK